MIYSVTEVLGKYQDFSHVPPERLALAGERGTAVHDACLLKIARGIPALSIPDECAGYVESFQKWFHSRCEEVIFSEERLVDINLGCSGQVDLFCKDGAAYFLIDLKTPITKNKSWRLQLAAYKHLVVKRFPEIPESIIIPASLRLHPEGKTPKMDLYTESYLEDFNYFLQALNVHRFFNS
jgi:hypothetical protein